MKFIATTTIDIPDDELLEIVNEQQRWNDLKDFLTLEEVPIQLIWRTLDYAEYFEEIIFNYLSVDDFEINQITNENN